jgi:lathosterol oxidase
MKLLFIGSLAVISQALPDITIPGLKIPSSYDTRVLEIDTFLDFIWATLYIGVFNYCIYLGVGSALEFTNPIPKTEYRQTMTKK